MQDNFDIVVLTTEKGEELEFRHVAEIPLRGAWYLILQPTVLLEGMGENEAFVFKVTKDKKGNDHFDIELDDDVVSEVFNEYYRLLEQSQ